MKWLFPRSTPSSWKRPSQRLPVWSRPRWPPGWQSCSEFKTFQDYLYQKKGRPKDDDGHDVVSADVGGAGEEHQHDEHYAACHHRHRVETARQEVDQPGHMSFYGTTLKPRWIELSPWLCILEIFMHITVIPYSGDLCVRVMSCSCWILKAVYWAITWGIIVA